MHIRERLFSEPVCLRLATAAYTAAAKHFVRELISNALRRTVSTTPILSKMK